MDKDSMIKRLKEAVAKYLPSADKKLLSQISNQYIYEELDKNIEFLLLRDVLLDVGTILEEDIENCTYVAVIESGVLNANPCIVVAQLFDNKVVINGFAQEGLIKQQTARKAINKLKKELEKG